MLRIDLNCDLGEGCSNDAELMKYISSANIACGYHAGDRETMLTTAQLAVLNHVAIGAHPSYPERENFGRIDMDLRPAEISDIVTEQIGELAAAAAKAGGRLEHVKPHGALYNRSARDPEVAAAIATAIANIDTDLVLFGLSGSHSIREAERLGLSTASEVFADRTYQSDGSLTPRSEPRALITDTHTAKEQVLDMIKYGRVRSLDAIMVAIRCETVCIHGDGEHSVDFAREINRALVENGIEIKAIHG